MLEKCSGNRITKLTKGTPKPIKFRRLWAGISQERSNVLDLFLVHVSLGFPGRLISDFLEFSDNFFSCLKFLQGNETGGKALLLFQLFCRKPLANNVGYGVNVKRS